MHRGNTQEILFNIPAETWQESAGISYGIMSGPLGEAIVYVPASCIADAQSIIEAYENNELSDSDNTSQSNQISNWFNLIQQSLMKCVLQPFCHHPNFSIPH